MKFTSWIVLIALVLGTSSSWRSDMAPESKKPENRFAFLFPAGLGIGVAIGAVIHNIGVGLAIGAFIGTLGSLIGFYLSENTDN